MTVIETVARISLVVPTRNEADNIRSLVARVGGALEALDVPWEVVFVDDSDDDTPNIVREESGGAPVRLLHRTRRDRVNGLSGAVLLGIAESQGEIVVVMDGDLQHPPEVLDALVAPLLDGRADIAVATRYRGVGRADGLRGFWRQFVSRGARRAVQVALPRVRSISDPLGGFFAFRREVVEGVELQPVGFKILLEILVRGRWATATEVPYTFASRTGGTSKASTREGVRFARHVGRLLPSRGDDLIIDLRDGEPTITVGHAPNTVRRLRHRFAAVVLTVAAAFAVSLWSLASAVRSGSDLAYVVVAAPLALVVLGARIRPGRVEPEIHDREIDALIGAVLLSAAALLLVTGTEHAPTLFWAHRVDLVAFPIFLAGIVALLLGTRTLWRSRAASAFAILTWPPAARVMLADPLSWPTRGTARVVGAVAGGLGIAASAGGQALRVTSGAHVYVIQLAADARTTATLVAFVLVAACAALVRRDPARRALFFVGFGAVGAWCLRVALTVAALAAGASGHPGLMRVMLGAWFDALAVLVALVATSTVVRRRVPEEFAERLRPVRRSSGRIPRAIGAVAVIAIAVAVVSDVRIDRNQELTTALGTPQLVGLSSAPTQPAGATLVSRRIVSPAPATAPADASWTRLQYSTGRDAVPSVVDVIDAPDSANLDAANVRSWYPVGWRTRSDSSPVALGDGVDGRLLTFRNPGGSWIAITWLWPVEVDGHNRIERVVVMPGAEPTHLTAAGSTSTWLDPAELPVARASLLSLSTMIAQAHLAEAQIPDRPIVSVQR